MQEPLLWQETEYCCSICDDVSAWITETVTLSVVKIILDNTLGIETESLFLLTILYTFITTINYFIIVLNRKL